MKNFKATDAVVQVLLLSALWGIAADCSTWISQ